MWGVHAVCVLCVGECACRGSVCVYCGGCLVCVVCSVGARRLCVCVAWVQAVSVCSGGCVHAVCVCCGRCTPWVGGVGGVGGGEGIWECAGVCAH